MIINLFNLLKSKLTKTIEFPKALIFNKQINSNAVICFFLSVLCCVNYLSAEVLYVAFCEPNFNNVPTNLINNVWTWYHMNLGHIYQDLTFNGINGRRRSFGGIYFFSNTSFNYFDGQTMKTYLLSTPVATFTSPHSIQIGDLAYQIHYSIRDLIENCVETLKILDLRMSTSESEAIEILMHHAQIGNSPYATTNMILGWIEQLVEAQETELLDVLNGVEEEIYHQATHTQGEVRDWYEFLNESAVGSRNSLTNIDYGLENPQDDF